MSAKPRQQVVPPDAVQNATVPQPAAEVERPRRRRGLRALRSEVHARLLRARALESLPPERYGFSIDAATWLFLFTSVIYRWYFRTQCFGLEQLPRGPVLLVANHGSHALAWDGANIVTACLLDAEPPRLVHGMAEHRLMELPILGRAARRIGAVDGTRPSCISLLNAGAVVLAFPEGIRALTRGFRQRYQLGRFGRGFAHVALATGAPVVPVAVIGAEEEAPLIANPGWLRHLMRTPVAPITPSVVVPLPVRYRVHFGAPLWLHGAPTPDRVGHETERVRHALARLIQQGLAARRHVFF